MRQTTRNDPGPFNCTFLFVPKMKFPQKMSLREVQAMRMVSNYEDKMKKEMEEDEAEQKKDQDEAKAMLDNIRKNTKKGGGGGFKQEASKDTYYSKGEHKTKKE